MKNLKVKQKWLAVMTVLAAFLTSSPVFAGGKNPFDSVNQGADKATQNFTALGFTIAVAMLVVAGIGLMLSQKMREWAKGHIVYVIIGVVVIVLASQAVPFIQQMFGG
ncbi:TrbC/VirB2 family protein [Streptococcus sanguinis]|uniref:TrbC/VirB2 family protein n=1 Tax=Streptococcus sanguinis TaxID=1305 RepID=A0A859EPT8_STRSA|nr:TrbC/VirB2 family protein [Streptococcus sanguinis]EFX93367.1 conjugal transfer protein TrbC [Streptococcus sanguinis VMC66]QKQ44755.1 TrbC/VirB2 family protein [Streptococcus sanguinis]